VSARALYLLLATLAFMQAHAQDSPEAPPAQSPAAAPAQAAAQATATVSPARTLPGHTRFDLSRPEIAAFVDRLAASGHDRAALYALLAKAEPQPRIIEAMSKPAEKSLAWWEYRARFILPERIDAGARLWREHKELLDAIAIERHVDPAYVLAIIGVETYYGRITGRYRVLDALATLAFDYPPRADYFRQELEQFLQLAREHELDPLATLGSYAGAMGAAQFMPSSFRRFAIDAAGGGRPDLWTSWPDIFASIANYLAQHGWEYGQPVLAEASPGSTTLPTTLPASVQLNETLGALRAGGLTIGSTLDDATPCVLLPADLQSGTAYRVGFRNFYVITRYNRSPLYAMAVHDLATALSARVMAADAP
jgi:membrane-bound lytic murein transglycosylase B